MTTSDKYLRAILDGAGREAQSDRSMTVEAEHLLLAIVAEPEGAIARVLRSAGLNRAAIRAALDREFEHSLSVAGVSLTAFVQPLQSTPFERVPQPGASVRRALERGVSSARKRLRPAHLLLGILQAEVGTVPRALALAGIDRKDLLASIEQTLAQPSGA